MLFCSEITKVFEYLWQMFDKNRRDDYEKNNQTQIFHKPSERFSGVNEIKCPPPLIIPPSRNPLGSASMTTSHPNSLFDLFFFFWINGILLVIIFSSRHILILYQRYIALKQASLISSSNSPF